MHRADREYTREEVMGMMEPLISTWFSERFTGLTEPQAKAIPVIHDRKNVLVSSPTGSGKTLTAFTSILNELTKYASEGTLEDRIYCIYISPLKALANDVNRNLNTPLEEMKEVAKAHGMAEPKIRVAVRSGDTSQYERQKMVRKPPHILITTPESLALVLAAPKFRERLSKIEWLILDEIHDMCDSKRGALLSLTLERLREHCETDFTRIGLSATLAPIEAIAGYLVGTENDGETRDVTLVESTSKKVLDLQVICPTEDMTAFSSDIVNAMMYDQLKELIDAHDTTLVFTNTRSGAESVVYKLKERGLESIEVHHSSLGKEIRLDVEERLKRGEIRCVVCSTSLELGIDIGSVDLVCQIGSPKSVAKGLQRIGRSGHSMGKIAKGRLLVFDPDDLVECAVMCRAAHRSDIDRVGIPEDCLDVLAQTLVGMSLDKRWDVDEAYDLVRGSYCYRNLPKEKFLSVLKYLGSKDEYEGVYSKLWYDVEENQFGRKKGSRMIYFMNLGTIPEEANYRVLTNHGSIAGELSEKFVERLAPRDVFVLGGRSFEFVRSKGMTAHVKEASGRKPTVPSWAGEMLPRSFDLSMDVAKFRGEMSERLEGNEKELIAELSKDFGMDSGSARSILSYFREQKAVAGMIPDNRTLAVEEYIDPTGNQKLIFHFPFGRRVNDALSRGYAYRISNLIGCNVSITMSDDSFMIGTSRKMDVSMIPKLLTSKDIESILRKAVRDSEIFKLRFRHTATRSFMILRNYMGRPVSVNRQQIRSAYLLDTLGSMDNVPVIEETYREVLEDDMDIKNARVVLDMIESGEMKVDTVQYSGTPSPFAHNVILSGFSDIVLMEDRSALLRELHRKVLYRAMGDSVKEFEFEEDQIIPYFMGKTVRITEKEDIIRALKHSGPLQAFRERGRNVYTYADADRKTIDQWCRELLKEGRIGTVFLDDPHIMLTEEIPYYASATRKERELNEQDQKVLDTIKDKITLSEIAEKTELTEDTVFRSLRKLESMYVITRTDISNMKWSFSLFSMDLPEKQMSMDRIALRHLECFAPATVQEVAYALSIPENEMKISLEALVNDGEASRGRFLISENDQYMKKGDHMRLRANKSNVYDHITAERYRQFKGRNFKTIEEFFKFYGMAGSVLDVFNRVEDFNSEEWSELRSSGRILLGRFVRGRVRFVLSEDGDRYASLRNEPLMPLDETVLKLIESSGKITGRQIYASLDADKEQLKESVMRLDRALKVIRAYDEREHMGSENIYQVYRPAPPGDDALFVLAEQTIRAYGPIPAMGLRHQLGISPEDAVMLANAVGAESIFVGDGQTQMFIMPDEIKKMSEFSNVPDDLRILSLFDPSLASKWAEISARYGDRWIYPIMKAERMVGALEIWEMSGCVEIRSIDMNAPEMLEDVLKAVDGLMRFFKMNRKDLVRIREILGVDAAELSEEFVGILKKNDYHFVNGFYAKGNFVPVTFDEDQIMSYVFRKQHAVRSERYRTVQEAIEDRGYVRTDAELLTRVAEKTTMKKQAERGLYTMNLVTGYRGYTTERFAILYRAAKNPTVEGDAKIIEKIIKERQPISRRELILASPMSEERTVELMNALFHDSVVYMDAKSKYGIIKEVKMDQYGSMKEVVRMSFSEFGMFTAEQMSYFFGLRMAVVRRMLAEFVEEGFLVQGFFKKDDPTVCWMLREDVHRTIEPVTGMLLLNTQDNLHVYFRDIIKREFGTENIIFNGTKMIGAFKGKLTASGAKIEDVKGSKEVMRFIRETAAQLGVRIEEPDDDWDVSEFYLKTNPGTM